MHSICQSQKYVFVLFQNHAVTSLVGISDLLLFVTFPCEEHLSSLLATGFSLLLIFLGLFWLEGFFSSFCWEFSPVVFVDFSWCLLRWSCLPSWLCLFVSFLCFGFFSSRGFSETFLSSLFFLVSLVAASAPLAFFSACSLAACKQHQFQKLVINAIWEIWEFF